MNSLAIIAFLAASPLALRPSPAVAQPTKRASATTAISSVHISIGRVSRAIGIACQYLQRNCDGHGRFAYLVDTDSGNVSPSYNIVRHAGAIYSLGMLNGFHPDSNVVNVMVRASNFMRTNYLAPDARSNALALWSRPPPVNTKAELGAAGLGLVAFAAVERAQPNTIPLAQMEALGRFVLFLQKPDGSFYSRYFADKGLDRDWRSRYYPGEAALG
jgi:hypothetical protein